MVTIVDEDEFSVPAAVPFEEAPAGRVSQPVSLAVPVQLTIDGSEPTPVPDGLPDPVALIFPSRHGGTPHVVNVYDMGGGDRAVLCRCDATRSLAKRPVGCWAMSKARRMLDIPDPT